MKTVGLVCEFNPLHHGHLHLLDEIRRHFGDDTTVVCVMSGNFVQRGEPALFDKWTRAEAAVRGGADLVLELPFPQAAACAERFADAAITVLDSLGAVDFLAFGSECGDTQMLSLLAKELEAPCFLAAYTDFSNQNSIGSAEKTSVVYREIYGKTERLPLLKTPNDLLGVSYIRALLCRKSRIEPLAFQRIGALHNSQCSSEDLPITSAAEARLLITESDEGKKSALSRLPSSISSIYENQISKGKYLADYKKWQEHLLVCCRLADQGRLRAADGLGGGLAARITRAANYAESGADFFSRIRTKKYTDAYLRRALLSAFFGISKEVLNSPPSYTQILAFGERGQHLLSRIRRCATIPFLTKPAHYRLLPPHAREAARLTAQADAIYAALLKSPSAPSEWIKRAPHRASCQTQSNDFPTSLLDKP